MTKLPIGFVSITVIDGRTGKTLFSMVEDMDGLFNSVSVGRVLERSLPKKLWKRAHRYWLIDARKSWTTKSSWTGAVQQYEGVTKTVYMYGRPIVFVDREDRTVYQVLSIRNGKIALRGIYPYQYDLIRTITGEEHIMIKKGWGR
jgi:hypothetical protein